MDMYSKYCFDFLKNNHPDFLRDKKFETEKSIIDLYKDKNISLGEDYKKEKVVCKFCGKKEAIERTQQIRSLDEGETLVTYCTYCSKTF